MARASEEARFQYLEKASHQLLTSSPATSAHLQTVRKTAAEEQTNATPSQAIDWTCTACGNILAPGWSCKNVNYGLVKRSRNDRLAQAKLGLKTFSLQCSLCGNITTIEDKKPVKGRQVPIRNIDKLPTVAAAPATNRPTQKSTESIVQASRKRTRGKKSTLQSMLSKQDIVASEKPRGFNMDLMDFMKS